ncbi:MAG: hypothetical protein AAF598_21315, partial [Bacteroidota bacterium]
SLSVIDRDYSRCKSKDKVTQNESAKAKNISKEVYLAKAKQSKNKFKSSRFTKFIGLTYLRMIPNHIMMRNIIVLSLLTILFAGCQKNVKTELATALQEKAELESRVQELESEKAILLEQSIGPLNWGIFFEVQIGAFEYFDLRGYLEEFIRLKEVDEEGMYKYVLGRFRSYEDAKAFRKDMQVIGVKDAFIVALVDGQRIVEEAEVIRIGREAEKALQASYSSENTGE